MSRTITYRQALNEAIAEEMRRDASVFIYGIDVADHKRIFGSSNGLVEEFGPQRCFSTPLSEDAMTGFGIGAAINGMRPIHVHMRVDFMLLAMNQITNMLASYNYGTCGEINIPIVIRAVIGRGWGQSWQHSKTMYACFAHIPGLKVIMPSRPQDAKDMLKAAIRDENPVICIEHRWLYDVLGEVTENASPPPLSCAHVIQEGQDVTIAAVSWMNVEALKASEVLTRCGVKPEIVDLRCIAPFDQETLLKSVSKTKRLIVADYDWLHCGFSAEIAATVYEQCGPELKARIKRLGFADAHCPCTRPLENAFYPNAIDIIRAAEKMLGLPESDLAGEDFFSYEKKFKGPF